jgi:Carboxymuconolactone decarboxylase family
MCASGVYGQRLICTAIVGYADLGAGDAIAQLLDRALEVAPERFRGVRQMTMEHSSDAAYRFMTQRHADLGTVDRVGLCLSGTPLSKLFGTSPLTRRWRCSTTPLRAFIALMCRMSASCVWNGPAQLRSRVEDALKNGCITAELREILLHTAVYCGLPAASEAFRVAKRS